MGRLQQVAIGLVVLLLAVVAGSEIDLYFERRSDDARIQQEKDSAFAELGNDKTTPKDVRAWLEAHGFERLKTSPPDSQGGAFLNSRFGGAPVYPRVSGQRLIRPERWLRSRASWFVMEFDFEPNGRIRGVETSISSFRL